MAIDVSNKRIIMIHGLASKPPPASTHELWQRCVVENIRIEDAPLASALDRHPDLFESAYWANATPHHIEDDARYVRKLRVQVEKVIQERRRIKKKFHVGTREKVSAFFKDRGEDLAKIVAGALTVKDDVMKHFLREAELYDQDQYIADCMRRPLEDALRRAWDDGREIAILSHSMGTFISYDVLWRFSHRSVDGFHDYNQRRVRMFVTMGSPLCDSVIRGILFARHHRKKGERQYPTNIDFWHNYACLGDVVSHGHDFEDVFFKPMRELGVFQSRFKHRTIDYERLHNPFEVVSHQGNRNSEKRNPHKSYGYLVQPRFGTWLTDFLRGRLR